MNRITGQAIQNMMRKNRITIEALALSMNISQVRVRNVRANGVRGEVFVMDWREAITGKL